LNVFVPKINNSNNKPVMLFIHGGNFEYLMAHDGRHLSNISNAIVVAIQYRLGALGFLMTGRGDDDIKGNFGILDQRMAIKWVKDNIASFGGDLDKVNLDSF
jgi:carboxylesterase type B